MHTMKLINFLLLACQSDFTVIINHRKIMTICFLCFQLLSDSLFKRENEENSVMEIMNIIIISQIDRIDPK